MQIPERNILVLGGGLIGAGWAVAFAGSGHSVSVLDRDAETAQRLASIWAVGRNVLAQLGALAPEAAAPVVIRDYSELPAAPVLVQEALPERLELKRAALRELEIHIPPNCLIASSSSGLTATCLQEGMRYPDRLFIAHPCNPPYLMPTVELCGGVQTAPGILGRAEAIYRSLGKTVLRLRREVPGHLINRLQFALWREAVHLAANGVASLADIEAAVMVGLAPRWISTGPSTVFHLAGGEGGLTRFLAELGPAVEGCWADLGRPQLDSGTCALLVEAMAEIAGGRSPSELAMVRDRAMIALAQHFERAEVFCNVNQKGGDDQ